MSAVTPRLADLAELVRLPAALSVPGDTLAGAAASGGLGRRAVLMPVASVLLYWAGMALNDYADRNLDREERPERPIPSGRVSPGQALALAAGLTAGGVGVAALAGGRPGLRAAAALGAVVWSYDLVLKQGPAGPVAMAAARGLDVMLGAGGAVRDAGAPAVLLATHTAGVTLLSRGEVHGALPGTAAAATTATLLTAGAAAATGRRRTLLSTALAGLYAYTVGRAQAAAVSSPDAATVRRATGVGIRGMVPLQSTLIAGHGAPRTALTLLGAGPLIRIASRVVSPT